MYIKSKAANCFIRWELNHKMKTNNDEQEKEVRYICRKRTKFFALPLCFEKYTITDEKVNIKNGFFSITEDDTMMYKIQDVRLVRSFIERIFCLGTIICYTGDKTHPQLYLQHIKKSKIIKEFLITSSEHARVKRRTIHTLGIDADDTGEYIE